MTTDAGEYNGAPSSPRHHADLHSETAPGAGVPTHDSRAVHGSRSGIPYEHSYGVTGTRAVATSGAQAGADRNERGAISHGTSNTRPTTAEIGVGGFAAPGVNQIVRHAMPIPPRGRKDRKTMGMKGQGAPLPLSADIQGEIIEIGARWRLALADGVITYAEAQTLKTDWDRFARRAGLLAETVDVVGTALAGRDGIESKRFIDKVMPLKRKRYLTVVADNDPEIAA
jgi:hypothetical protein